MKKITIGIDSFGNKELKEYLLSLKGIRNVKIKNLDSLNICIEYDQNLITEKLIKQEILLFLDLLKLPSIIYFDKHSSDKTSEYKNVKENSCCEYCIKNSIESLFEIDGIDKVKYNFDKQKNLEIIIDYEQNKIKECNLKEIEMKLKI